MIGEKAIEQPSRADKARLLQRLLRDKAQKARTTDRVEAGTAFLRDVSLDPAIQPCGEAQYLSSPAAILLTGATGFLGAHLLDDLLRLTNATIYCVVRAESPAHARQRLLDNLAQYSDSPVPAERIVPVLGDLAKPRLGLAPGGLEDLAARIDVIFHNGATLNHLAPYERLRAANVMSTVELLRLARTTKPKWIHYVSSMIAAADRDDSGALLEQSPIGDPSEITGGYAQSKWVSEKLLGEARSRGFGVTVYRPGIIGGRRDTGAWPIEHDHLLLLIKGCLQMGYAPESPVVVDLTPVDFVSEAIVRLSFAGPQHPVLHLSNPNPVPWMTILGWMQESGHSLKVVPFEVWSDHLSRIDENNALFPLLPVYLNGSVIAQRQLLISKLAKVNRQFTTPLLACLNLEYPAIGQALWRKYVMHCADCGFFPALQMEVTI